MKRAAAVHHLAWALAGLGTAFGFLDGPYPWLALLSPFVALAAVVVQRRRWNWAIGAAWLILLGLSAASLLLGARPLVPLTAGASALIAWDLAGFQQRAAAAPVHRPNEQLNRLERAHLRRLLPVVLLAWLLGLAASGIRIQIGFYAVLLLGAIAAFGLNQLLRYLRRETS